MSLNKRDFYGKEVTDAIKAACETLEVPQEQLEIEVVETGSMGIFGLIRKKAHIRAQVKAVVEEAVEETFSVETLRPEPPPPVEDDRKGAVDEKPAKVEDKIEDQIEEPAEDPIEDKVEDKIEALWIKKINEDFRGFKKNLNRKENIPFGSKNK